MKVLIDIDEELYKNVVDRTKTGYVGSDVWTAVANGIPYEPKGDLISREALKKHKIIVQQANGVEIEDIDVVPLACIDNAPTVSENGLIAEDYIKEKMFFVKRECDDQAIPVIAVNDLVAFERPQGRWIKHDTWDYSCSLCDAYSFADDGIVEDLPNFCPNCGAQMQRLNGGRE